MIDGNFVARVHRNILMCIVYNVESFLIRTFNNSLQNGHEFKIYRKFQSERVVDIA
jgi:hypothetical protein